jgi:site-specific recombinase XerC
MSSEHTSIERARRMPVTAIDSIPEFFDRAGLHARVAYIDFLTSDVRALSTRTVYASAVRSFCSFCEQENLSLRTLRPYHVVAYVDTLTSGISKESVRNHLSKLRVVFAWLVQREIMERSPFTTVRGPKHRRRSTLQDVDVAQLLRNFDVTTAIDLRDRALIALLNKAAAGVTAITRIKVGDYFWRGGHRWVRLHSNGSQQDLLVHEPLKSYIDEYIAAAGLYDDGNAALFRSAGQINGQLGIRQIRYADVLRMIRRRSSSPSACKPV